MNSARTGGAVPLLAYASLATSMAVVGSYVGLSKLLVAAFPIFLLAWLRFGIAAVPAATWVLLGFYSIAASMVTVWLWMQGLRHVPAPQAGVFTVMLPISAALVGVMFLGEAFGTMHLVAFVLSLAGLLLATWPDQARRARP